MEATQSGLTPALSLSGCHNTVATEGTGLSHQLSDHCLSTYFFSLTQFVDKLIDYSSNVTLLSAECVDRFERYSS